MLVDAQQQVVDAQRDRARRALGHRLDREADAVDHHLARVRALSPLATMQRGYAVAQAADGGVLTSVHDVPDAFVVRLADGSVDVTTTGRRPSPSTERQEPDDDDR